MIRRFHEATARNDASVTIWGTGTAQREFLHVDDMADPVVPLMQNYSDAMHINVGYSEDLTILELVQLVARMVGHRGQILTDPSKPDGTPRKLMDVSRLTALGWKASIPLDEGVAATCRLYRDTVVS